MLFSRLAGALASAVLLVTPAHVTLAQVTDYLIIGESEIDFDGQVSTHSNAVSGTATIDESVFGSPELTNLELDVAWTDTFDATALTGCVGSTVTMDSLQTLSPAVPQSGTGDSDTSIAWGTLTGWTQTGRLVCTTSAPCPPPVPSACAPFVGFEGTGPPLPLAATGFDSDPWQFIGPGSPKVAFLTEPLRITDLGGPLSVTQDIDLVGVRSSLVSVTPTIFCVVGLSTGNDWSWQIDSEGINDVTNPGAGSSDADLAQAFVDSINLGSTPPAAATASFLSPSCFSLSYTGPYQLFVGPQGSTPCLVSGNPVGCSFNPVLIEQSFLNTVPIAPLGALAAAAAAVLGVGRLYARRNGVRRRE